jgi:hypothetical protein
MFTLVLHERIMDKFGLINPYRHLVFISVVSFAIRLYLI